MQWSGRLYPVLLPAPPEGCLVDAQDPGRLLQRSGGSQNAADVLLLDLFQAHQIPRQELPPHGEAPGRTSTPILSERQRMEARSTTLRNSRRFPGHA